MSYIVVIVILCGTINAIMFPTAPVCNATAFAQTIYLEVSVWFSEQVIRTSVENQMSLWLLQHFFPFFSVEFLIRVMNRVMAVILNRLFKPLNIKTLHDI